MNKKLHRGIYLILFAMLFALAFSACGGGHKGASPDSSLAGASLSAALAELDDLETPGGVDAQLFADIKAALRKALLARGTGKLASTPPTGASNAVPDLTLTPVGGMMYDLTWHYYNVGDYNQDGSVGIADITPLAMHYGEAWVAGEENSLAAVIDGSGNGTVDIADVTPIAMNFGVECAGYHIGESATEDWSSHADLATIPLTEGTGKETGRMAFVNNFAAAINYYYWVAPVDSGNAAGTESNSAGIIYYEIEDNDAAPTATPLPPFPFIGLLGSIGANPPDYPGYDGDNADWFSFNALASDQVAFEMEYDTDTAYIMMQLYNSGGIMVDYPDPIFSPQYMQYTITADGTYYIYVCPQSVGYTDYFITGALEAAFPVASAAANPTHGAAPLSVNFDASGSTGVAIADYAWDFEGDGTYVAGSVTETHEYASEGWYIVGLRITDGQGLTAYDTVTVTVGSSGYDEMEDNDSTDPGQANTLFPLPIIDFKGSIGTAPPGYLGYDGDMQDMYKFNHDFIGTGFVTVTVELLTDTATGTYLGIWDSTDLMQMPLAHVENANPLTLLYADIDSGDRYVALYAGGGYADYILSISEM